MLEAISGKADSGSKFVPPALRPRSHRAAAEEVLKLVESEGPDQESGVWLAGVWRVREAVPLLLDLISDDRPEISMESAIALGLIGSKTATKRLVGYLRSLQSSAVRTYVVYALRLIGDQRAERELCRVAVDRAEPSQVRSEATEALASLPRPGKEVFQSLTTNLRDQDPEVRFFAIYSCGELGHFAALPELTKLTNDGTAVGPFGTIADEAVRVISQLSRSKDTL